MSIAKPRQTAFIVSKCVTVCNFFLNTNCSTILRGKCAEIKDNTKFKVIFKEI